MASSYYGDPHVRLLRKAYVIPSSITQVTVRVKIQFYNNVKLHTEMHNRNARRF